MVRMAFARFRVLAVFISFVWSEANGLCMPEHPQTSVCRAKFVLRARIISVDWEKDSRTTKAPLLTLPKPEKGETDFIIGRKPNEKLLEVFKHGEVYVKEDDPLGEPGFLPFMKPKVIRMELVKLYKGVKYLQRDVGHRFSVTFSSARKSPFQIGKTYLVTGFALGKELLTNECNWISEWDKLSKVQRHGVRRFYWIFCRCEVRFCPHCKPNYRRCNWNPPFSTIGFEKKDFYSTNRLCMVRCNACGWHDPAEKTDCTKLG